MTREITLKVREAVRKLFLEDSTSIEERLLTATGFARAHQDNSLNRASCNLPVPITFLFGTPLFDPVLCHPTRSLRLRERD
jgi:hypothetical protein